MSETKSDFGKGFVYNLILFAKHWWKSIEDIKIHQDMHEKYPESFDNPEEDALEIWFDRASDHLYELEIPERFKGTEIQTLTEFIKEKGLEYGRAFPTVKATKKDFDEIFKKLEKLAILIDKELGIEDIEAQWR